MTESLLPAEMASLRPGELLVNETFSSIQGEGLDAGRPCFFIRLAGCHLRCAWCDTAYAFHQGRLCLVSELVEEAVSSGLDLVEVTGGEPLLQRSVHELLGALCDRGLDVLLETSGALPIDQVDPRVRRVVDWKCPGSGMDSRNHPSIVPSLRARDELKLVVLDRTDYEWARAWIRSVQSLLPPALAVHLSPVFGALPHAELARWIIEDHLAVRLGVQVHKWVWGPDARGV